MAVILIENIREGCLNIRKNVGVTLDQQVAYDWLKEPTEEWIFRELEAVPLLS